jgi:hypothetical protein
MYSANKQARKKTPQHEATKYSTARLQALREYLVGVNAVIANFGQTDIENAFNAGFDEGVKCAKR